MKFALDAGLFAYQSWEETFELYAKAGITYVELSQRIGFIFHEVTEADLKRVGKLIEQNGLKLAGMIPMVPLASPLEEERHTAVDDWKRFISVSAELGAKDIFAEMTGNAQYKKETALCTRAFQRSIDALIPVLEDADMQASFEPHPGDFLEDNKTAVDMIREIGHPRVGYLFCMPHSFLMGTEPAPEMVAYAGKSITHTHIADTHPASRIIAPPEVGAHEHMLPGWGEVDFPAIIEALRKVDYEGFVSAPLFSHADRDPKVPLNVAIEMKNYAVSELGVSAD